MSTTRFIREIPPDPMPPDWGQIQIAGVTACGCGCGSPACVMVTVGGRTIHLVRPAQIDAMIATLEESRRALWGEPS